MVRTAFLACLLLSACHPDGDAPATPAAAVAPAVALPAPQLDAPAPLMQALSNRHSTRGFQDTELTDQQLSDLLWAAFGQNRSDGGRTAPSAYGNQEIDVYLALSRGTYRYDHADHGLVLVVPDDLRALTGTQDFVADAPLNLVYVANYPRMDRIDEAARRNTAGTDVGFIGQNVYLLCASQGLATVFRGSMDGPALHRALGLEPTQEILYAQTVGYAAD
jgi:SagB-type dehydrogenase family enzyme